MADSNGAEPFPSVETTAPGTPTQHGRERGQTRPSRSASTASAVTNRLRSMSKGFEHSNPPEGFMAATGDFASSVFTLGGDGIRYQRRGSGSPSVPSSARSRARTGSSRQDQHHFVNGVDESGALGPPIALGPIPSAISEAVEEREAAGKSSGEATAKVSRQETEENTADEEATEPFQNGYHFPPSYPKGESFKHAMVAFWQYFLTPLGFLVVVYGLNVVAWGGMLFLLLCNAAPAMCHPDCNDINSPRRKWVEIDSQILNSLFCVTGFGLAPWRFRDWYYLLTYRIMGKAEGLRHLAGIHRGWLRLSGSENLPIDIGPDNIEGRLGDVPLECIPIPEKSIAEAPLTGTRAPPTKLWRLDFVVWMNVSNTFLQCVLSGFMWGMTRYNRPSWATGLFVALGCIAAGLGGIMMFVEGKRVKRIEGVPLTDRDREVLERDKQLGIPHYNNIKDKKPKVTLDKAVSDIV
ncbi:COBW domain-containing protein [Pleurostoma richardsiae]|uniref:COBW domain-containing protein n=1 Tax=Pleurostoma richardsiae TaxID=41990 RepID=A0AA38VY53_9PEZI|nr:COBW domain-containing protein [Pleurostoma richardsiae]